MVDLSIGEVARRAGVSASAIRYYERQGLLQPPPRRSGRRCYDKSIVLRLQLIRELRGYGKSISELNCWMGAIREGGGTAALRELLEIEIRRIESRVSALDTLKRELTVKLGCDCTSLADCRAL